MQRILTVIGARPQFIKASMVSRAIQSEAGIEAIIFYMGQHFVANMSDMFLSQLDIPRPQELYGGAEASRRSVDELMNAYL